MKLHSKPLLEPPGINKIFFKSKFLQDLIFFLVVVALPSSFFSLIPLSYFYDYRLIFLLASTLYVVFNFKYLKKISNLPGGMAFITLNIFLVLQIGYSLFIQEIPFTEVVTVFRANFFYPIAALGFLLYVASFDNRRIYRFMYWLLLVTFIQGLLYVFSNTFSIDIFAVGGEKNHLFQGKKIMQNMFAIPHYNAILFTFIFLASLTIKEFNKDWLWFIPLVLTLLSIVRSQVIVYILIMLFIIVFAKVSKTRMYYSKILKISLLSLVFAVISAMIFPSHISNIIDKSGLIQKESITFSQYTEEGTYAVRLGLIKEAYNKIEIDDNLIMGSGYIREGQKGEYDFVFGGDTLIAPVLFTEGFIGIILRVLPIAILLMYFFKLLFSREKKYNLFGIVAISLILPEMVNVVQTKYFVYYTREILIIFVLAMIIYNDKKLINKEKYVS
jgi:hypothetical protein